MTHQRIALLALSTLTLGLSAACSSSSDSGGDLGGPGGPKTGVGGGSGIGGSGAAPGVSPEDFGYAEEAERSFVPHDGKQASAEPLVATVCGTADVKSTEVIDASVPNARIMASATRARETLNAHQAPVSASLRTQDFLNYYDVGRSQNTAASGLSLTATLRAVTIGTTPIPRQYQLFVGIQSEPLATRPPVALTVVVDTTPSMAGEPFARAKKALRALTDALAPNDHLSVFVPGLGLVFDQTLADPAAETLGLEGSLDLGDESTLREPLETALSHATTLLQPKQWNRVVLISDGQGDPATLPIGPLESAAQAGISSSSVGVGGSFVVGDAFLNAVSQAGHGSYVYVEAAEAADASLRQRFDRVFGQLYKDVKLTVTLPWFLTSLDPPSQNGGAADLTKLESLPPDSAAAFVFNLQACHDKVILKDGANYPLSIQVSATNTLTDQPASAGKTPTATELLNGSPLGLDQVLATQSFVSALKAPTKNRFTEAFERLVPLKQPGNAFEDMWSLLDRYPKKP
ncbi:MAG: VWA domain-containing protein [Myxococcales bacterium]|nr:VWA domain-containing protein [Myxococcales bacterium]